MLQQENNHSIIRFACVLLVLLSLFHGQTIRAASMYLNETYISNNIIDLRDLRGNWAYISAFGKCVFNSEINGLARIILVDEEEKEYLVGEWDKRFCHDSIFSDMCVETAHLQNQRFSQIKLIVHNATLKLDSVELMADYNYSFNRSKNYNNSFSPRQRALQWNNYNAANRKHWYAKPIDGIDYSFDNIKNVFYCGDDNYYSIGIEYYAGGIFELEDMGGDNQLESNEIYLRDTVEYTSHFDWRERHGRNWITSVKSQIVPTAPDIYGNGGCWVFSPIAATEALTNLYFNRSFNLDLSEQEVGVCTEYGSLAGGSPYCSTTRGGNPLYALDYIRESGVCDENCMPFMNNCTIPCTTKCNNPTENIHIGGYCQVGLKQNKLKSAIINCGPLASGISHRYYWHDTLKYCSHAMCMVGFGTIAEGDTLKIVPDISYNDCYVDTIIHAGDSLIGRNYWIFKNSFGETWGHHGYLYAVFPENGNGVMYTMSRTERLLFPITSINYSSADIAVTDEDNDGYYFWGLGPKPSHCPICCPDIPDGDDSDPTKGEMDSCGIFSSYHFPYPDIVKNNSFTNILQDSIICGNIYLNQATMLVNANLTLNPAAKIVVNNGSLLLLNQYTTKATIVVKSGGRLQIQNGAILQLRNKGCLHVELGGELVMATESNVIIDE